MGFLSLEIHESQGSRGRGIPASQELRHEPSGSILHIVNERK